MDETPEDLVALQELLDRSYERGGAHLLSIHTSERKIGARDLASLLTGMRLLVLATSTRKGWPLTGAVDGIFFRGSFYFGTSRDSVRASHVRDRREVSATHLPGEDLCVTVHGSVVPIDLSNRANTRFRETLLSIYIPRYGDEWRDFLDAVPVYYKIEARSMFAMAMPALLN